MYLGYVRWVLQGSAAKRAKSEKHRARIAAPSSRAQRSTVMDNPILLQVWAANQPPAPPQKRSRNPFQLLPWGKKSPPPSVPAESMCDCVAPPDLSDGPNADETLHSRLAAAVDEAATLRVQLEESGRFAQGKLEQSRQAEASARDAANQCEAASRRTQRRFTSCC